MKLFIRLCLFSFCVNGPLIFAGNEILGIFDFRRHTNEKLKSSIIGISIGYLLASKTPDNNVIFSAILLTTLIGYAFYNNGNRRNP